MTSRALGVARAQIQDRPALHGGVGVDADAVVAEGVHVLDQLTEVAGDDPDLQGPRRGGVADRDGQVGQARQQGAAVGNGVGDGNGLAVDVEIDPAEEPHVQARRRDDEVGVEVVAGLERDPGLGEPLDPVGDDGGAAVAQRGEEVAVGAEAQALIPRLVRRVEVGVHGIALRQGLGVGLPDECAGGLREGADELHLASLGPDAGEPGDRVSTLLPEQSEEEQRRGVDLRPRYDVGRRALQHGDVRCGPSWFSMDGISVTAVAPLPMTTTLLPA